MKRLITITLLAVLAGCAKHSQPVIVQPKSPEAILVQLKVDLAEVNVEIQGRRIDLVVKWTTCSDARWSSRPLDVILADNKLCAFVSPIQNLTPLDGPSLQDVSIAFGQQIKAYLKKNHIPESALLTGIDIKNYMKENAEQNN